MVNFTYISLLGLNLFYTIIFGIIASINQIYSNVFFFGIFTGFTILNLMLIVIELLGDKK
jgi:hypothetical protein